MFKLAWTDGWMNMKQSAIEAKITYFILVIILIAGLFWQEVIGYCYAGILSLEVMFHPQYGQGKLLPDIFSMVPMNQEDKKKYILYRSFGIEGIIYYMLGAILIFEIFVLGTHKNLDVFLLLLIWMFIVVIKEQFYRIYKLMNGKVYYPNMKSVSRHFFRIIRVSDYVSGLLALICVGTISNDSGTYPLSHYLGPGLIVYWMISVIYFVQYVKRAIERLELPEML
jgi:hypothetical protein